MIGENPQSGLKVIGAGWGRTGTMSLMTALNRIGLKSYHMNECFAQNDALFWIKVSDGEKSDSDFAEVFNKKGYQAAMDFPASIYYKRLMKQYPDAKVILTIRDAESWYQSCCETIFKTMPDYEHTSIGIRLIFGTGLSGWHFKEMFAKTMTRDAFGNAFNKEAIIEAYNKHNEEVRRTVPTDKLLVLDLSKGEGSYDTLCSFLDVPSPSPDEAFPKVNDALTFSRQIEIYNVLGISIGVLGLGIPFLFRAKYNE